MNNIQNIYFLFVDCSFIGLKIKKNAKYFVFRIVNITYFILQVFETSFCVVCESFKDWCTQYS